MESQLERLLGVRGTSSLKCGNGGMMLKLVSCLQTILSLFLPPSYHEVRALLYYLLVAVILYLTTHRTSRNGT